MARRAKRGDPELWERVKSEVTEGDKGGRPGQWSARKAQMAVQEYKKRGGGYEGPKSEDNALAQWTREDWGTRSGARSRDSGERYLPEAAREELSDEDYDRTSARKRRDTRAGEQFSRQPDDVARKTAKHRAGGRDRDRDGSERTRADLYAEARRRDIPGRSKMRKEDLLQALAAASGS